MSDIQAAAPSSLRRANPLPSPATSSLNHGAVLDAAKAAFPRAAPIDAPPLSRISYTSGGARADRLETNVMAGSLAL